MEATPSPDEVPNPDEIQRLGLAPAPCGPAIALPAVAPVQPSAPALGAGRKIRLGFNLVDPAVNPVVAFPSTGTGTDLPGMPFRETDAGRVKVETPSARSVSSLQTHREQKAWCALNGVALAGAIDDLVRQHLASKASITRKAE